MNPLDRIRQRANGYGYTTVAVEDVRLLLDVIEAAQEAMARVDALELVGFGPLRRALAPLLEDE